MNNAYTLKQILFALRQEYIEVEKKLKELEKYVNITGHIDDISFHIHDFNVPKTMDMYLIKKQTIADKIKAIFGLTSIYTRGVAFWKVPEEMDAACYWKGKKVCSITDSDEFTKSIKDIMESDFIKNVHLNIPRGDDKFFIHITARSASLFEKGISFSPFSYNSKGNYLNVKQKGSIITTNYIEDLFNIKFERDNFSDYYKGVIDNYEEKEIDIIDSFNSNEVKLRIIEEPKKLILKPKKII